MAQSIKHVSKQVPDTEGRRTFVVLHPGTVWLKDVLSFLFRSKGGKGADRGRKKSHWNFKDIQLWCNWLQFNAKLQQLGLKKQVFQRRAQKFC